MGRFADPYGDDRLPEGMTCTGYDADTGRKYYVDRNTGGTYVGAPYADYGVLTPLRSSTTAQQDNARYGRRLFDEGTHPAPKRRANTAPVAPIATWSSTDSPRIIPRRPQKVEGEEEPHPKHQDGSEGPKATSKDVTVNRSKTHRRAKSVGTWDSQRWKPYISSPAANQIPSEDEEVESSAGEGQLVHATTPKLGESSSDQDGFKLIPPAGTTSAETPTDCVPVLIRQSSPVPFLDADQGEDSGGEIAVGKGGKKRRRTILHKLFRVK